MTDQAGHSPADFIVATNIATKIQNLMEESFLLAQSFGTQVTLQQILSGVLIQGFDMAARPLTREEYLSVYDYVMARRAELERADAPQPEAPSGPEATAHAATSADADRLAAHWGDRISEAVFSFEIPELGGPDG